MSTLELKDKKTVPDPIYPYLQDIRDSSVPVIVDNGSYQCRVGWAVSKDPLLVFKNVIAKPRKERGKKDGETLVGNNIANIEAVRFQLKSPFDRNIVTHFETQEQVFDHIFTHLGIDTEGSVEHPVVITEAFLNPNHSRYLMSELLFECYGVPGVCYGVDGLFSFQYNYPKCGSALIVNCGHHTTHIMPVVNGRVDPVTSKRINIGGYHITAYLHRLLQLKYPAHYNAITLSRAEELVHDHTFVAEHYLDNLELWADTDYYENHVLRVQLPYISPAATSSLSSEQQKERRKELSRRLNEINARKREERLAEDEEQLSQLLAVQELADEEDEEELEQALESCGLESPLELQRTIRQLMKKIGRTREKIVAANASEEALPEEIKPKDKILRPEDHEEFETWLADIRAQRKELLRKRNARRLRKQDMARRRTAASQERMRIISELARKEKGDDNFGMRDEDWDVYKVISKESGDTDSDEEQKLMELEDALRQHDPAFEDNAACNEMNTAEHYQLHVGIERLRVPEILFQPSMIGYEEMGLIETIEYMLRGFHPRTQAALVSNVFLTGGCARLPGLETRLKTGLQEILPFGSSFEVTVAENPSLDAWYGAKNFAASYSFNEYLITKLNYDEQGGEYLKEHACSNIFYSSPVPLPM